MKIPHEMKDFHARLKAAETHEDIILAQHGELWTSCLTKYERLASNETLPKRPAKVRKHA